MGILHRYLVSQFAKTFVMAFICVFGLMAIGDFVGHLSEFMDGSGSNTRLASVLAAYYGARVPWFLDKSGAILALLASVFVLARWQRYQEFTAVQAAGISRWQVVKPLVFCAAGVAILGALNREFGIPRFQDQLCHGASDAVGNGSSPMDLRYDPETNILFDGKSINARDQSIEQVQLRLPSSWPGLGRSIRAEKARFQDATAEHPSGYRLSGVESRIPLPQVSSVRAREQTILFSPKDFPWLGAAECFVYSRMPVEAFRGGGRWRHYASTSQLIAGIQDGSMEFSPDVRVTTHARFVQPVLDLLLLFLGLPFALESQRRHVFSSAAKSLAVITIFSLIVGFSRAFGIQGVLAPALAAWLPLAILAPAAVWLSGPLRR
jgi:lipopolysaccharide export LptBFGC system permease protein LptF